MSYKEETDIRDNKKCEELLQDYPKDISKYIISVEGITTPKTRLEYAKDICKFYGYVSETCHIDTKDIDVKLLDGLDMEFYDGYLHHLRKTNSEVTIKRKLSSLRSYYAFLFERNLISSNKITKMRLPKLREKEIIRMDNDETISFVNTVKNGISGSSNQIAYHKKQYTRDMAIVYLLLSTGIRVSELVGLDMNDIDLKSCSARIIRKGGRESIVWFSDQAADYLKDYIEKRKNIITVDPEEKALFLSSQRKRMCVNTVEKLIKKYAQQAVPLKNITVHKMRSTFGTDLYEKTGDIYLVAESLGHKDISTTQKHYANLSNKRKESVRNLVTIDV